LIPPAPIAGQTDFSKPVGFYYDGNTRIAKPGECCTESWLVAGTFDTETEAISYRSYIFTKTVRFLLLQTVVSQHVTKKNFCFVPDLGKYKGEYTDEMLREMWGITDEEWSFIDSRIGEIGGDSNGK
jgi:site-specific DNA-methyltransferase (adenine-specific)